MATTFVFQNLGFLLQFMIKYSYFIVFSVFLYLYGYHNNTEQSKARYAMISGFINGIVFLAMLLLPIAQIYSLEYMGYAIFRGLVWAVPILFTGIILFQLGKEYKESHSKYLYFSGIFWIVYGIIELIYLDMGLYVFTYISPDPLYQEIGELILFFIISLKFTFSAIASTYLVIFATCHGFRNLRGAGYAYLIGYYTMFGVAFLLGHITGWYVL